MRPAKSLFEHTMFALLNSDLNGNYMWEAPDIDAVYHMTCSHIKDLQEQPRFKYANPVSVERNYNPSGIAVYTTGVATDKKEMICGFIENDSPTKITSMPSKTKKIEPKNPNTGNQPAGDQHQVVMIPMHKIVASPTNPRKTFDPESIKNLADSMRPPVGLLQAITLRPFAGDYEIVAGERRYQAAKLLEWDFIPSIIRDISDDEMLEFQIIENLQREDVAPLDEAHAFKTLLQKENIDWLASRIHKTKKYITDRLKLNDLVPEAAELVSAAVLPLGHAVVISKLSFADQKACITKCIQTTWDGEEDEKYCKTPLEELKSFISGTIMLEFARAPFSKEDETLYPAAGSCAVCPKRTCNNNLLFHDITSDDKCTDAACFNEKIKLHIEREKAAAKEKYGKVLSGEKSGYSYNNNNGTGVIKVQGVEVPYTSTPTKNTIPVVITKTDTYSHQRASLGQTVYIDKNKVDQVKLEKEEKKLIKKSSETWEQQQLREFKEKWDRVQIIAENSNPVAAVIKQFFRGMLDDLEDHLLYAFAGNMGFAPEINTPEQAMEIADTGTRSFKREHKTGIMDKIISHYTPEELIMIIMMLKRFDDDEDDEVNPEFEFGLSWKQIMAEIKPGGIKALIKPAKAPAKKKAAVKPY